VALPVTLGRLRRPPGDASTASDKYRDHRNARVWALGARGERRRCARGSCGFRSGFEEKELEVGFTIAPSRWGRGYATEIAGAVVELGFEHFGAPRIWSLTSPANLPSLKVLEKIGMRYVKDLAEDGATWAVYVRTAP